MTKCLCGLNIVEFSGNVNAEHLLILDAPDFEDVRNGFMMAGDVAEIMRNELRVIGIDLLATRVVSLWRHAKPKKKSECTVDDHVRGMAGELKGHRSILVMGNEASKILFDEAPLMDVCGLLLKSDLIPEETIITAAPNPFSLLHGMKGEMDLSLQKYRRYLDE